MFETLEYKVRDGHSSPCHCWCGESLVGGATIGLSLHASLAPAVCIEKQLNLLLQMARVSGWRQTCPPAVRAVQQLATLKHLYLLRQSGPTAFLVQEANCKPEQVRLGDPHNCSCKEYRRSRDLCLHICWVLLKKLQLKLYDTLSYQLGLVDRELTEMLEPGCRERRVRERSATSKPPRSRLEDQPLVTRRPVLPEDKCPICLLEYRDTKFPVVHCRYSCGNAVHTRCMVQVARHQLDSTELATDRILTCPLCRGPFCRGSQLAEAARRRVAVVRPRDLSPVLTHDVTCVFCQVRPIVGNLYRCLQCPQVVMCASCVRSSDYAILHESHGYAIKKGKWQVVRAAHWAPPSRDLYASKFTKAKEEAEESGWSRACAHCGLSFHETELWVGQWRDYLFHMSCIEQWRSDPFRACNNRRGNSLPLIEMTAWPGPPEVRVVRLNLSTRPQELRASGPESKPPPRPPRPHVSPLRTRPRRHKKKKTHKNQTDVEDDSNKLPMSVTLGRALGAQVQPLMAILMSPRVRTRSLDSDCSGDEHSEDDEKAAKAKTPLLSITSLELPDLAGARGPPCQPVRRVRTSVRRARPPAPPPLIPVQTPHQQNTQTIACAGLALATARRP